MKKFLGLLALLAVMNVGTQTAFATSPKSVLLQYSNTPKMRGGMMLDTIVVYIDGTVVHREINPATATKTDNVLTLKAEQVEKIIALTKKAEPVEMGFQASHQKCFIAATHTQKFVANNGSLFLREGAGCDGGWKINKKPAAITLAGVLSTLDGGHHQKTNIAVIENKINALLK